MYTVERGLGQAKKLIYAEPEDLGAAVQSSSGSKMRITAGAEDVIWQPKYPWKSAPRRNKFDHYAIIQFLLTTESTVKKTEDNNTVSFIVEVKANKHQIKQEVKKLCDINVAEVNTLIQPDGEKKAYVPLALNYNALDMANKTGVI
ncbi:60S ribosomal protein L23a-like [Trichosurus vulpecula]|uniref:60S ribosomal protein L23a-like n=1 Tax=Trichosurus vulpecula TaxID=9337 RepID=UPI00186B0829|nr:60S ribosomal protein L23a-like [Trichosurus vulpecula]